MAGGHRLHKMWVVLLMCQSYSTIWRGKVNKPINKQVKPLFPIKTNIDMLWNRKHNFKVKHKAKTVLEPLAGGLNLPAISCQHWQSQLHETSS